MTTVYTVTLEDFEQWPIAICASIEAAQEFVRPMIKIPDGATDVNWHTKEDNGDTLFGISYLMDSPRAPWLNSHRWSIEYRFESFEVIE